MQGPGPASHDPVAAQLTPADRDAYEEVFTAVNAKLLHSETLGRDSQRRAHRGNSPPLITDDRIPALKSGLDDLRNRLSPAGWQIVEKFLNDMAIGMGGMAAPAK